MSARRCRTPIVIPCPNWTPSEDHSQCRECDGKPPLTELQRSSIRMLLDNQNARAEDVAIILAFQTTVGTVIP